jgi:TPR repeat protein
MPSDSHAGNTCPCNRPLRLLQIAVVAVGVFAGSAIFAQGKVQKDQAAAATKSTTKASTSTEVIPNLGAPKLLSDPSGKPYRWRIQPDEIVRLAAERGDCAAMDSFGDRQSNSERQFSWYLKSAQCGYLPGMMDVAASYQLGNGVKADPSQAKFWTDKAVQMLPQAWAQQDGFVQEQVGMHFLQSVPDLHGAPADALKWIQRAAANNDVEALERLAGMTEQGYSVPQDGKTVTLIPKATDYHQWFAYVQQAAETGDPGVELDLSMLLMGNFPGLPATETSQGVEWSLKAAAQGYTGAYIWLATANAEGGTGITKDEKQALEWYRKAAEAGNAVGLFGVGRAYLLGTGVPKNTKLAIETLQTAANNDVPQAVAMLRTVYESGVGVPVNNALAEKLLRRGFAGAGYGEDDVNFSMALVYLNGDYSMGPDDAGPPRWYLQDEAKAFEMMKSLAEKHSTSGQAKRASNYLATMYERGVGVKQDYTRARYWYEQSFNNADSLSAEALAHMYEKGEDGPVDYSQAMLWHKKALQLGNLDAANSIGLMYAFGEGVSRDPAIAYAWFAKAWAEGSGMAVGAYNIGNLYHEGYGVTKDFAQANAWYQKAADKSLPDAQVALGDAYHLGQGVPNDSQKAASLYYAAANSGSLQGLEKLARIYISEWTSAQDMDAEQYPKRLKSALAWFNHQANGKDMVAPARWTASLIGRTPNRWEGYALWGAIERNQRNFTEAEVAFKHALDRAPDEAKPQLAVALQQIDSSDIYDKRLDSALSSWKSKQVPQAVIATAGLISSDPNRWEGYGLSAAIEKAEGKANEARFAYERALALAPENDKLQIAMNLYRLDAAQHAVAK